MTTAPPTPPATAPAAAPTAAPAPARAVTGTAASAGARTTTRPGGPARPPGRRDTRRPGGRTGRPPAAAPAHSPLPHQWFAQQLLLVLSGRRPVHALLRHVSPAVYEQLNRIAPQAPLAARGTDRTAPVLAGVGAQRPCEGAVEAFARIAAGRHRRVMAFRLQTCDTGPRWRCTALELDGLA